MPRIRRDFVQAVKAKVCQKEYALARRAGIEEATDVVFFSTVQAPVDDVPAYLRDEIWLDLFRKILELHNRNLSFINIK